MKRKHSGLVVFLIILLILIAVPVAFYLYLSNSAFEIDEINTISHRATLPLKDRFRVSAADDTMDIRLNKSDTAYIVIDVMGLDEIRDGLEENDIRFDCFGLSVDDGFVSLELNARWKDFLPLPVKICFAPDCKGSELKFKVEKICLGPKLKLGGSIVRFIGDLAEVTVDMTSYSGVFKNMVAAYADDDILTVTVSGPLMWLTAEVGDGEKMTLWRDYLGVSAPEEIINAIKNEDAEAYHKWLEELEAHPDRVADLKWEELVHAAMITIREFYLNENGEMFERIFPNLDEASIQAQNDVNNAIVAERRSQLCGIAHDVAELFCAKGIATDGKEFYNLKAKKEPLSIYQFSGAEEVEQWLDISTLRFVFGHVSVTYMNYAPALKKLPTIGKNAFDHIDETQVYIPYMVFVSAAGRPVMAYEIARENIALYDLSFERYESVMAAEWIPYIDQRMAPT